MRLRPHCLALPAIIALAACGDKLPAPLPGYAEVDNVGLA